ncbi:uncharacterized protein LOC119114573 isoform X3 [Pollicipes pollicipes]|uniref:uncharacterized protein LOC119114573 isoform X3 n=1 Tax=Pollicipes pollicipes TaxID=41117 RepID=UPI001884E9B3|nr:uncharacterized protein LOC119114573 isoform X3 [Pollicipes pollicipes]XP_037094559.1 uncharacterized protein LOC119114573 isoform X3 [Pollicipes pollicipes]
MVHWKRDLDLYTIGRPLERNAGFWLNYMKGLKVESRAQRGTTPPLVSDSIRVDRQYSSEVATSKRSVEVKQALVAVKETRPVYQLRMAPAVPQYTAGN